VEEDLPDSLRERVEVETEGDDMASWIRPKGWISISRDCRRGESSNPNLEFEEGGGKREKREERGERRRGEGEERRREGEKERREEKEAKKVSE